MYCNKCGKEISNDTCFCPFCGSKIVESNSADVDTGTQQGKKKSKLWIIILALLAIIIAVAGYFYSQYLIKQTIIEKTSQFMDTVKEGPSTETMDEVIDAVVPELIEDETISSYVLNNVSGEDVLDVYHAMMKHMEYEIIDVEKIESSKYSVKIRISNMNNELVSEYAIELYKASYTGNDSYFEAIINGVQHALSDLNSDKSQLISEYLEQSSDELYDTGVADYRIQGVYAIQIMKENGQWTVTTDYVDMGYACLGLEQ